MQWSRLFSSCPLTDTEITPAAVSSHPQKSLAPVDSDPNGGNIKSASGGPPIVSRQISRNMQKSLEQRPISLLLVELL